MPKNVQLLQRNYQATPPRLGLVPKLSFIKSPGVGSWNCLQVRANK